MTRFRIKDWNDHFENNRSRGLKTLDWVPVPNKMDGDGYTDLVDHSDGAAHFGAWVAIVEIASRQEVRGTIPVGRRGLAGTLSAISRLPTSLFDAVLPRLIEIGWIEQYSEANQQTAEIPHDDAGIPHPPAEIRHDDAPRVRARTEQNRTEGKRTEANEWPVTMAAAQERFPSADAIVVNEIAAAALAVAPDVTDSDLALALRETWRPDQLYSKLWKLTVPGYLKRRKRIHAIEPASVSCETCNDTGCVWAIEFNNGEEMQQAMDEANRKGLPISNPCPACRAAPRMPPGQETTQMALAGVSGRGGP